MLNLILVTAFCTLFGLRFHNLFMVLGFFWHLFVEILGGYIGMGFWFNKWALIWQFLMTIFATRCLINHAMLLKYKEHLD